MDYELQNFSLDLIELQDRFFKITSTDMIDDLIDSIGRFDLINPPYLYYRVDHWSVVSGFRRIAAAKHLQWREIPVRVLKPNTPIETAARIAVIENSSQRPLNIVEQSNACQLLETIISGYDQLLHEAKLCGLPLNRKMIDALSCVNRLPEWMKSGVIDGAIALPMVPRLLEMKEKGDLELMGELLVELNLSLNRQRELMDWIETITHKEKVTVRSLLQAESLRYILLNKKDDPRQRVTSVRQWFRKRCYPSLSEAEHRFDTVRKKINPPHNIQIFPSNGFESPTITFQIQCATPQEFSSAEIELRRMVQDPLINNLFDTIESELKTSPKSHK
jgi:ParB family chromosome partitioning protein